MSSNLTIEPYINDKKIYLPDQLKFVLQKRRKSYDIVSEEDLGYFEALADADIEGAQEVLDMIKKYGTCVFREEF